jgi:hypothetical protein
VIGSGLSSAIALAALVDGGLDARGVCTAVPPPDAEDVLTTRGVDERLMRLDARVRLDVRSCRDGDCRFEIVADDETIDHVDAVVLGELGGPGSSLAGATPSAGGPVTRFGGVFDPDSDGVYLVGIYPEGMVSPPVPEDGRARDPAGSPASSAGSGVAAPGELAWAQARWVGEYLRGRYLLPERSVMLGHPGLPAPRRLGQLMHLGRERPGVAGYLARLEREQRRGRGRAAAASYPLPVTWDGPR